MPDDFESSPTFNVKDLRPYHREVLRTSLFYQLWGIDAGANQEFEDQVNWVFRGMQEVSCMPRHDNASYKF